MIVAPLRELRWTIVHVEAVGHVAAQFANEKGVLKAAIELDCILQSCNREAAPACRHCADHGRSCANYINRDDGVRIDIPRRTRGKAIDDDSTRHC